MLVRQVMTRQVLTLRPGDSLREAVSVFARNRISGAPVVDDQGRVVGILTEMDILRRLEIGSMELGERGSAAGAPEGETGPGLRFKTLPESLEGAADLPVSRVMTSPVVTARPEDPVQEKAALMVHRRIRRLPVVDGKGRLVGILSRKDLIRTLEAGGRGKRSRKPGRGGIRG